MENESYLRKVYLFVLLIGVCAFSACEPALVKSTTDDMAIVDSVEIRSTETIESDLDINDWDEVTLSPDLTLRNIDDGVIEVIHQFPWAANSLLVQMPDGTFVWAGSTYTPEAAAQILRWLEQNYGAVDVVGIITGYHVDNLGGSAALIEKGYPVYGSDLTVDLLAKKGGEMRAYMVELSKEFDHGSYADYHRLIPYLAPTHMYSIDEGLTLVFGDETVQVYYPGPTQTEDKVAVIFPERKIVFGSCMVLGGDTVGNTSEADMLSWIQAIMDLKRWNAEIIIPGHGDGIGSDLLDHTIELLENYQATEE